MTINKSSLLIPSQLPEFIRDDPDYENFVLFLQAYYEWLEEQNNVIDYTKNLLTYNDIDNTTDEFLDYFYKEFLSYFPSETLLDKKKSIKIARELYQSKGTTASYKFLFKIVFNADAEFFFTKDAVLKPSSGSWYVAQYLLASTNDSAFLNISNVNGNYKVLGQKSKAVANIETTTIDGNKTRIYISNIQRNFISGETISIVDNNLQTVVVTKYDNQNNSYQVPLTTLIAGSINSVLVDPLNSGLLYQTGDPVVFYGGLTNPLTQNSAIATVGTTTAGSLKYVLISSSGYGYRASPNTIINFDLNSGAVTPTAVVPSNGLITNYPANVAFLPTDTIGSLAANNIYIGNTAFSSGARPKGNSVYYFANNSTSNANTTLANAFTFTAFSTYPISIVNLNTPGSNISVVNSITAQSLYNTTNTITGSITSNSADIQTMGILAPIQIVTQGTGYTNNDTILIMGGTGYGAYANVSVNAISGAVNSIYYVYSPLDSVTNTRRYPLGGMGYKNSLLPKVTISSTNPGANGATFTIPAILGTGAQFSTVSNYVGQIQNINVDYSGSDYISTANVSLKVQDILVTGLSAASLIQKGDFIYQGTSNTIYTYGATVDSVIQSYPNYILRVYNYTSIPQSNTNIKVSGKNLPLTIVNTTGNRYVNGVLTYGDGTAKATAQFVSALTKEPGRYLDTRGQLSFYNVLQSTIFNDYTYEIIVQTEISKYRKLLKDLIHPAGMNFLGRYRVESGNTVNYNVQEALHQSHSLKYYTGLESASVTVSPDPTYQTKSNNILTWYVGDPNDTDVTTFVFSNSTINFWTTNGDYVSGEDDSTFFPNPYTTTDLMTNDAMTWLDVPGLSDDFMGNTNRVPYNDLLYNDIPITIFKDNVWTTFANVANVTANAGSNVINISSLTGSYDLINGGVYSNVAYPIKDIIRTGDNVLVRSDANTSNSQLVTKVDYANNLVYVANNYTSNVAGSNSYISVNRTYVSNTGSFVRIFGPLGLNYIPYFVTEDEKNITTEDGDFILIG